MFIGFSSSENLGEFRIRGSFIVGLYLRNISNENLGTSSMLNSGVSKPSVRASHQYNMRKNA